MTRKSTGNSPKTNSDPKKAELPLGERHLNASNLSRKNEGNTQAANKENIELSEHDCTTTTLAKKKVAVEPKPNQAKSEATKKSNDNNAMVQFDSAISSSFQRVFNELISINNSLEEMSADIKQQPVVAKEDANLKDEELRRLDESIKKMKDEIHRKKSRCYRLEKELHATRKAFIALENKQSSLEKELASEENENEEQLTLLNKLSHAWFFGLEVILGVMSGEF